MTHCIEVRRTYQYRLYRCDKRDQRLHRQINIAGTVWNHALSLQKRYYRLTGKYVPLGVLLKSYIAKLRRQTVRYAFRNALGSQTVQDVLDGWMMAINAFSNDWRNVRPNTRRCGSANRSPSSRQGGNS
jgi:helix-turn-helix protein